MSAALYSVHIVGIVSVGCRFVSAEPLRDFSSNGGASVEVVDNNLVSLIEQDKANAAADRPATAPGLSQYQSDGTPPPAATKPPGRSSAAGGKKGEKGAGRRRRKCDAGEARRCFRHGFYEVGLFQARDMNCAKYATYMYCFDTMSPCGEDRLGQIASELYLETHRQYQPKELFIALYGALYDKCANPCAGQQNWNCRQRMTPAQQDRDQAIYMELGGQTRQLELGLVAASGGCANLEHTLRRWIEFRSKICADLVACSCAEPRLEVALRKCGLPCKELVRKRSIHDGALAADGRAGYFVDGGAPVGGGGLALRAATLAAGTLFGLVWRRR